MFPRLADGQAVTHTDLVRYLSQPRQIVLFKMQLPAGFKADRVDEEVRVDVRRVRVRCNDDFVVVPLLCQLQRNGVRFLRRDTLVGVEGLHEVKIHFAAALAVLELGADELCEADLRLAVYARDQAPAIELGFPHLHDVGQHSGETGAALSSRTIDGCDRCHSSRLPLQDFLELFLYRQIERIGLANVDGADPAHVRQCRKLVEIRSLLPQRTGEVMETVNVYDLFPDGAGRQILCQIHPRGFRVPPDSLRVRFRDAEGQCKWFCAVSFFLQMNTSVIKWVRASARKWDAKGHTPPPP